MKKFNWGWVTIPISLLLAIIGVYQAWDVFSFTFDWRVLLLLGGVSLVVLVLSLTTVAGIWIITKIQEG